MISELLKLVCPGPAHGGPGQPPQRASDADRDLAADILCAAVGDGRLTLDELDERLGAALSARTITELAVRIADLPGRRCTPAQPARPCHQVARSFDPGCLAQAAAPSRWSVIQALADARAGADLAAAG